MKIFNTQDDLKKYLADLPQNKKSIGFVPTMGALHQGHLSLISQAKKENDLVICSIFVNPTQFNDAKDFENYPHTHLADIKVLEDVHCDILYLPNSVEDVYKNETGFSIDLGEISTVMEGANRPGHFDGVVRVVKLLFEITTPNKAYFGLKDFQQFAIIKKMVSELNLPIEIVGCPIIREESGLAMSSRNALLSKKEKEDALILNETLRFLQKNIKLGDISKLLEKGLKMLAKKSKPEYLTIAETESLRVTTHLKKGEKYRAFVVSKIGNVRLIDNMEIFI